MPDATVPPGYRPAGTVTMTFLFAGDSVRVQGNLLEHQECGGMVLQGGEHQCPAPVREEPWEGA